MQGSGVVASRFTQALIHLHTTESSASAGARVYVFLNVCSVSVKTGSHCAALDGLQLTM